MNAPEITAIEGIQCFQIGREAVISINPATGMVIVSTIYHRELNGMHYWCHRGPDTLAQFLISCSAEYVIRKLFDSRQLEEFDADGTTADIRAWIIDGRRESGPNGPGPSAKEARGWWDEAGEIEEARDMERMHWLGDEWYEFIKMKPTGAVGYFERMIWGPFIEHLKATEGEMMKRQGKV